MTFFTFFVSPLVDESGHRVADSLQPHPRLLGLEFGPSPAPGLQALPPLLQLGGRHSRSRLVNSFHFIYEAILGFERRSEPYKYIPRIVLSQLPVNTRTNWRSWSTKTSTNLLRRNCASSCGTSRGSRYRADTRSPK